MSGLSPERLRAITYDTNTRPNVTITDRYHAVELLAEVKRLREGIESARCTSREMQRDERSSVTLAFLQEALCQLLNPPTEGETDHE